MGRSNTVTSFLYAIEQIRQLGDSSDIAFTLMVLDLIEQNDSVMQDYLNDDSVVEIYEDMPVGNVLLAIMSVLKMNTLLMAEEIPKLAEKKAYLDQVITVLQTGIK